MAGCTLVVHCRTQIAALLWPSANSVVLHQMSPLVVHCRTQIAALIQPSAPSVILHQIVFLKSHPFYDQKGGTDVVFSLLSRYLQCFSKCLISRLVQHITTWVWLLSCQSNKTIPIWFVRKYVKFVHLPSYMIPSVIKSIT
jgi:hypothetical protein